MSKYLSYIFLFAGLFVIGYLIAEGVTDNSKAVKRTKILMGTVVEIQVRNEDEETANKAIDLAFNEINRIDKVFSAYDKESQIYAINNSSDSIFEITADVKEVLICSDSLWKITDGAFDASLFELMNIWGFTGKPSFPGSSKIKNALERCGWRNVTLKDNILNKADVSFDFGAIAKGYAVDKAVEILRNNNIKEALVNAGGEIKSTGGEWNIGIQDPESRDNILALLKIEDMSVATSGDYEQFFEYEGKRYHHILDPSTGYPGNKCRSVTVIAKENYMADGLATGVFIMGTSEGLSLIEKTENTEAMIIDSSGKILMSSGFNNYIVR